MDDINRLKIVLVEKKKTGKWLAGQLGKNPSTVSKWCSNVSQPDLATLVKVAELLEVDIQELINKNSSFAFAKHHSSSLLAVKKSPSPEGRDLGRG